ncbi:MAG: 50S ribosomal protein L9 [Deltaproteobacteria bacterium]|nr:50S ribosomal protein L9 [Deltaproteobacteria bacterium]
MEVILQEDVANLGAIGEVVKVRPGYGRNYLIPRGLAVEASRRNLHVLEHQKRLAATKKEKDRQKAQGLVDRISSLSITIAARAGEEDRLFGSVTNIDIEKALTAQGVAIDRRKIVLVEPIKQLGTYTVPVHLSSDVRGNITVNVVRES